MYIFHISLRYWTQLDRPMKSMPTLQADITKSTSVLDVQKIQIQR